MSDMNEMYHNTFIILINMVARGAAVTEEA